jgi:hypothetical protein
LLLVLLVVLVFHAIAFHRLLSLGLAVALVLAASMAIFTGARIQTSHQALADAREKAFDPVHELWQARAAAYEARQSEAQTLLDPAHRDDTESRYDLAARELYRLSDANADIAGSAHAGQVPPGAGGMLAQLLTGPSISSDATTAAKESLARLGDYRRAHETIRPTTGDKVSAATIASFGGTNDKDNGYAFNRLVSSIDRALTLHEGAFDNKAQDAQDALDRIDAINVACAIAMLGLVIWGLWPRLREYSGT